MSRQLGAASSRLEALEQTWGQAVSPRVPPMPEARPPHSTRPVSGWASAVSREQASETAQRLEVHEQLRELSREFELLLKRHGRSLSDEHETRALRYRIAVLEAEKDQRREKYSRLKARMKKRERAAASSPRGDVSGMAQQLAAQDRIIQALREENLRLSQQAQQAWRTTGASAIAGPPPATLLAGAGEPTSVDLTLERSERFFQDAIGQELERIAAVPTASHFGSSRIPTVDRTSTRRHEVGHEVGRSAAEGPFLTADEVEAAEADEDLEAAAQRSADERAAVAEADRRALSEWLAAVGLGEYALSFSLEGFDDLSLLLDLEPEAVEDLTLATAMRFGHAAKFKIRLAELQEIRRQHAAAGAQLPATAVVGELRAGEAVSLVRSSDDSARARGVQTEQAIRAQLDGNGEAPASSAAAAALGQPLFAPALARRTASPEPQHQPGPEPEPEPEQGFAAQLQQRMGIPDADAGFWCVQNAVLCWF